MAATSPSPSPPTPSSAPSTTTSNSGGPPPLQTSSLLSPLPPGQGQGEGARHPQFTYDQTIHPSFIPPVIVPQFEMIPTIIPRRLINRAMRQIRKVIRP